MVQNKHQTSLEDNCSLTQKIRKYSFKKVVRTDGPILEEWVIPQRKKKVRKGEIDSNCI